VRYILIDAHCRLRLLGRGAGVLARILGVGERCWAGRPGERAARDAPATPCLWLVLGPYPVPWQSTRGARGAGRVLEPVLAGARCARPPSMVKSCDVTLAGECDCRGG